MTLDSLMEHLQQSASSPPHNLVVLYIKKNFLKAQNILQKLIRYFFVETKDVPKGLIEKVSFYGERGLRAILGFGVLNLTLTALYFVMPLASATSSLSVCAAIALSALASEIYCFAYNMYSLTFSSSEQKIVEIKSALKEFEQDQTEYRKAIKQILTHFSYEDAEITPKSLHLIQKHLKAMDFDGGQQLLKTQNMSDLAKHFSQPIKDYFTQMKKDNEKLHKSYLKELDKVVNSKIKGDKPWSPANQSFLCSAAKFLEVQKVLKDNFNIKICFKEALLHQIKVHGLYRREKVKEEKSNLSSSSIFCRKGCMQKDILACAEVIDILSELGESPDLDKLKADIQLGNLFFSGQRKMEFSYSEYLDEDFFSKLEGLQCHGKTEQVITKDRLLLSISKMSESQRNKVKDITNTDFTRS